MQHLNLIHSRSQSRYTQSVHWPTTSVHLLSHQDYGDFESDVSFHDVMLWGFWLNAKLIFHTNNNKSKMFQCISCVCLVPKLWKLISAAKYKRWPQLFLSHFDFFLHNSVFISHKKSLNGEINCDFIFYPMVKSSVQTAVFQGESVTLWSSVGQSPICCGHSRGCMFMHAKFATEVSKVQ